MAEAALIGLVAGSAVTGVVNASNENDLKNQASQYNEALDLANAKLSLQEAAEDERRLRVQNKKDIGQMRANYGASGVTIEGSPLDVLREGASIAELDALTVRHQGDVKAWAYENNARLDRFEGYASSSMLPGRIAGSLFGAGTQLASTLMMRRT
jgi:hypothetical protein